MICAFVSVSEFIEQFPCLSKREVTLIANKHEIEFRSCLTTRMRKDVFRRHTCVPPRCSGFVQVTCMDRQCKAIVAAPMEAPRDPLDEMAELRQKEKKWSHRQCQKLHEGEREIDGSVKYPPVRSIEDKAEKIREW